MIEPVSAVDWDMPVVTYFIFHVASLVDARVMNRVKSCWKASDVILDDDSIEAYKMPLAVLFASIVAQVLVAPVRMVNDVSLREVNCLCQE